MPSIYRKGTATYMILTDAEADKLATICYEIFSDSNIDIDDAASDLMLEIQEGIDNAEER